MSKEADSTPNNLTPTPTTPSQSSSNIQKWQLWESTSLLESTEAKQTEHGKDFTMPTLLTDSSPHTSRLSQCLTLINSNGSITPSSLEQLVHQELTTIPESSFSVPFPGPATMAQTPPHTQLETPLSYQDVTLGSPTTTPTRNNSNRLFTPTLPSRDRPDSLLPPSTFRTLNQQELPYQKLTSTPHHSRSTQQTDEIIPFGEELCSSFGSQI